MMRTLVIGANGFLGSHVVDALTRLGHDVTAFDRFLRRDPQFDATGVSFLKGDFLDNGDIARAVDGQDEVFHFLSATTPVTAQHDPTLDVRINITQSIELFAACARAGVKRIHFASTGGAIYGSGSEAPLSEQRPALPTSPYAIGKLTLERYLEYFRLETGLEYRVLRISNPYGARQNPDKAQGLIPIALRQILAGKPLLQYGDGSMVRDYVYVEDLVEMIKNMLLSEGRHRTYNLGSGVGTSIIEVFDLLREVTRQNFEIVHRETPPTFVGRAVLDVSRFKEDFGEPRVGGLREGIARTWDQLRTHYQPTTSQVRSLRENPAIRSAVRSNAPIPAIK
jgi:UDP-glucose 4-epimerase